jgi:hypothetical protein
LLAGRVPPRRASLFIHLRTVLINQLNMSERLLVLPPTGAAALATVRDVPGLRAAHAADGLTWLRGLPAAGELPLKIKQLPATAYYWLDAENRLFPVGKATPTGRLPTLAWQPLAEFLPLEIPTAALPGELPAPYRLQLVPTARPQPGAALRTAWAAWQAYAEGAAEVRLAGLRFAASGRGEALLMGTPLPPLPGHEYWQHGPLLLPAGFELESPLLAELFLLKNPPLPGSLVLLHEAGDWEAINPEHLVSATRSAVRCTAQTLIL